jgi:UDPglucose--hexose-1-phosphate uridylyltransferase
MCAVDMESVWKSTARLSDGREIVYFDEMPDSGRVSVPDLRVLPPAPPGGEATAESAMRWDALAGEWVVIAAARQDRTFLPPADQCPLCPSQPGRLTEIPAPSYDVVVFENRFPSLRGRCIGEGGGQGAPPDDLAPEALSSWRPSDGRCEVVCFTSDHNSSFASLTPERVRTVVEAWADRTQSLSARPDVEQVYCFENRGEEIGVTLHHPHGQIYAFPFLTPKTRRMIEQARTYEASHQGRNLFDDLVGSELGGTRLVARNEHWVAFVPEAARWPYQVRIFPVTRRVPDIPSLDDAQRDAFGALYLDVLRRFDRLFGSPAPYIAAWHQAPTRDRHARDIFAAHLEVFSLRRAENKLKYLAGTESGMGVWINDIVPEAAAQRLRDAGPIAQEA